MSATPVQTIDGFAVHDHVWITAKPRPDSVQWVITALHRADDSHAYATVWSPHSSRNRVVPTSSLTLHSKGKS